jgi:hypothetical protein
MVMVGTNCQGPKCQYYNRVYQVVKSGSNGVVLPRMDLPPNDYCLHPEVFTTKGSAFDLGKRLQSVNKCPLNAKEK